MKDNDYSGELSDALLSKVLGDFRFVTEHVLDLKDAEPFITKLQANEDVRRMVISMALTAFLAPQLGPVSSPQEIEEKMAKLVADGKAPELPDKRTGAAMCTTIAMGMYIGYRLAREQDKFAPHPPGTFFMPASTEAS